MSASYKELLAKREELEKQIAEARKQELTDAVAQVRKLVAEYGLSADDVFPPARGTRGPNGGGKVEPKYKNPVTGETWTGRGKAPKWIAEKERDQFLIK